MSTSTALNIALRRLAAQKKPKPSPAPLTTSQPAAALPHTARVGVRVMWAADAHPATIGDYWKRLPDGRVLASYTPDELAEALDFMGHPVPADVIQAELNGKLRELPPLGAGELPPQPAAQPAADPAGDYWGFIMGQEGEALVLDDWRAWAGLLATPEPLACE